MEHTALSLTWRLEQQFRISSLAEVGQLLRLTATAAILATVPKLLQAVERQLRQRFSAGRIVNNRDDVDIIGVKKSYARLLV
ncbi:hypothetical protein D3C76_1613100 [compost metagenome]